MARLEALIEAAVVAKAVAEGWYTRKLKWVGRNGAPDRIFIRNGAVIFIEFKDPAGVVSAMQEREIRKLKIAAADIYICTSVDQGDIILELKRGS